ncbi:MAG: chemotaxis protein CheB [Chloroflexota bacterium]
MTASAPFPIIGIGSSAGGLEALELFLTNVPKDSGMAFVIVQHLDPTRKDLMVELLQRCTTMPVMQVKDRTPVKPNCVYVIPPNYDMSILHDVLHLLPPVEPRGLRLPIDFFLRSLAQDRQQYSIGVILSGMGSDGTLGLRAIKEKAGMIFVQELASAKFDGMPQSAIRSGLADVIAPVEALPDRILSYLRHAPMITEHGLALEDKANNGLEKVVILLRSKTGHDFSLYKKTTIYRRIERRMAIHQIEKISTYVRYLQENPQELDLLFQELLIGVTSFFRDPAAWEQLKKNMLSKLLSVRAPSQNLRAWVPAASTGEEAYSLAILFMEAMEKLKPTGNITLQIFATDLDKQAVDKAREGVYPANIAADVSAERLKRYFVKMDRGYQVIKSIREMVVFAPQNIIMDPPFTKLDILCCRNLLIYLTPELQKKLMPLFHYSLNPAGILFLGSAETVGTFNDLFTALDTKSRLYQRHASVPDPKLLEFPSKFISPRQSAELKPVKPVQNLEVLADQLLLQTYAPAAVLTNDKGDILYISGRTGKYLEPAAGKVNWNIFAMARKGISYELSGAFNKALRQKNAVTLKDLVVGTNGGKQTVEVILQPVNEPEALRGLMMVVFKDVAAPLKIKAAGKSPRTTTHSASKIADLEQEVGHARHEVQTIREEMQTSQEELKSANEELQSTNEELQSTNEELTTSKEEMQSMNEELQTINHELQSKLDELSHTNDDMKNLLDSTDIATLFLDKEMHVRRFTSQTTKVTKLIAGDVGRPITDIASDLLYAEMDQDAREVLRTLVSIEKQVATLSKRWFSVRILPYRTLHDMIDGVVITFTDITISKNLEAELRRLQTGLEKRIDDQHELLEQSDARLQLEKQRGQSGKNDETKSATEKKDTPT